MRKNFFTVRVAEHWHRVAIDVMESPLEICKTNLDTFLCDLLQGTALTEEIGIDPQRSFSTPKLCDFVIVIL